MEKYWNRCPCGAEFEIFSRAKYHMRYKHDMGMAEYREKFDIKKIPHNKKYESQKTEVSCNICDGKFLVDTRWHAHRLRRGKNRFACPSGVSGKRSDCVKKLQSITIKEIRSTAKSRAKTSAQMTRHWSSLENRAIFGAKMKAKGPAWHSKRMAACLKSNLSGKMTKPEKAVACMIAEKGLPFKYVGAGGLMIGQLNPDFVSTDGSKRIVEVFGCYWHGCQRCFPGSKSHGIPKNQRLATFAKHGYRCAIIWGHEMDANPSTWQDILTKRIG